MFQCGSLNVAIGRDRGYCGLLEEGREVQSVPSYVMAGRRGRGGIFFCFQNALAAVCCRMLNSNVISGMK